MINQLEEIYTAKGVAEKLGVKVSKVHEYRHAGLIRMFRTGTGFLCTGKEFQRFVDMLTEYELDLSTPEKIILAGQLIKKEPVAAGSIERK